MGPATGRPAIITTSSTCCNVVQLDNTEYVAIRNLTVDSKGLDAIDGINGHGRPTHDILIESCVLVGQGHGPSTVGISTKSPAWNWVIRGNRIVGAGTGMYLGNSDGTQPFIAGLVESNLIENSIGYNLQIKHQKRYDGLPWVEHIPPGRHRTILRNNVFVKTKGVASEGDARPSLLLGCFPDSGRGSEDRYEVYGNFFYNNPDESLIQASGRVAIHDNVFVASSLGGYAIVLMDHNGPLVAADVYNNTVYSRRGKGIRFVSKARKGGRVAGNLIFADAEPLVGSVPVEAQNVVATTGAAAGFVNRPSAVLGEMDFYPKAACRSCQGAPLDSVPFAGQLDFDRDFNGSPKGPWTYRGAYAGGGVNSGWRLSESLKTGGPDRPVEPLE
jgi:hypothetical protein